VSNRRGHITPGDTGTRASAEPSGSAAGRLLHFARLRRLGKARRQSRSALCWRTLHARHVDNDYLLWLINGR